MSVVTRAKTTNAVLTQSTLKASLAAVLVCAAIPGAYAQALEYDLYLDGKNVARAYPELTGLETAGCRDPWNTIVWLNIVSGSPREVQDGTWTITVVAEKGSVSTDLWNFRPYFQRGDCIQFRPSGSVKATKAAKNWYGVDMLCMLRSPPDGSCYWLPTAAFTLVPRPAKPEASEGAAPTKPPSCTFDYTRALTDQCR
jgi:hypothetical protein